MNLRYQSKPTCNANVVKIGIKFYDLIECRYVRYSIFFCYVSLISVHAYFINGIHVAY